MKPLLKKKDVNQTNTPGELMEKKKLTSVTTDVGLKVLNNVVKELILLLSVVVMANNVDLTQSTEDLFARTKLKLKKNAKTVMMIVSLVGEVNKPNVLHVLQVKSYKTVCVSIQLTTNVLLSASKQLNTLLHVKKLKSEQSEHAQNPILLDTEVPLPKSVSTDVVPMVNLSKKTQLKPLTDTETST